MRDDRQRWEERHGEADAAPAMAPSAFVVRHAALVRGRVLDIACGSGRNAIFLARRGCAVVGVDLALAALRHLQRTACRERLLVHPVQADLECHCLPAARFDAVINIRYLQRSLFGQLEHTLKPGGVLLFETFLVDQLQRGHPRNPAYLLRRGELAQAFPGLERLEYEEGLLAHESGSDYLARLLARKPAG